MKKHLFVLLSLSCLGCDISLTADQTASEMSDALDETRVQSQALTLATSSATITKKEGSNTVDVETTFTLGEAVNDRLEKIKEFIQSQVDCAAFTIGGGGTLTVEYGAIAGKDCEYLGQTYSGTHSIKVNKVSEDEVVINHVWQALSNQKVTVSGKATVTWNKKDKSRRVQHDLRWQGNGSLDDRGGVGTGDRTQTALEGGWLEGIRVDGEHAWKGKDGKWRLDINTIEMRWVDPVPQNGLWELTTPYNDKQLIINFERTDDDTIQITASSGGRTYTFDVTGTNGRIARQ
jgi:hypothetical protein